MIQVEVTTPKGVTLVAKTTMAADTMRRGASKGASTPMAVAMTPKVDSLNAYSNRSVITLPGILPLLRAYLER